MSSLIFVQCFLHASKSVDLLQKHRQTDAVKSDLDLNEAMFDGIFRLLDEVTNCAREATKRGQLLYLHAGTTVLQHTGVPA